MKKKGQRPITRVKNPEPKMDDPDWIIWAAWADRITFEEIEKKTGKKESYVIKIMRRSLKPSSFRLWRKRVNQKSIKPVSYTHLRAHETRSNLVCRLLLEKKKKKIQM